MADELIIDEPTFDPETGDWSATLSSRETGKIVGGTKPRKTRKTRKAALHEAKAQAEFLLNQRAAR